MPQDNPFAYGKTNDTFINRLFGPPIPVQVQREQFAQSDRIQQARSMVIKRLQSMQSEGLQPNQIMQQLLQSEEFVNAVATDPNIGEFVQSMVGSLVKPPPERADPGSMALTPEGKPIPDTQVPALPNDTRSDAEKLTDAIIEANQAGEKERVALLRKHLPRDNSGDVPAAVALRMRAAGVKDTGNLSVDKIDQDQARKAVDLARGDQTDNISINDLAIRATGNKSGNAQADELTPEAAEAALKGRAEALGAENTLLQLFGALAGGGEEGAASSGLPGTGGPSVFERFREKQSGEPKAKPAPAPSVPTPGAAPPTPGPDAAGEVPTQYTPAKIKLMSADEAQALAEAVLAGKVILTPDASAELVGKLRAKEKLEK